MKKLGKIKKNVFSLILKHDRLVVVLMSWGRLFRNFWAANIKARSSRVFDDSIGGKWSKAHDGQQVVSDFYGKLEFPSLIARHYFNNFVHCEPPKLYCLYISPANYSRQIGVQQL